jgi:hypothetical protein
MLVILGLAFTALGVWFGASVGWDLSQVIGRWRSAPAWLLVAISFLLGASGLVAGTIALLAKRAEKQRAANVAEFQSILRSSWKREELDDDQ